MTLTYKVNCSMLVYMKKNINQKDIMEIDLTRLCQDYLEAAETIRQSELLTITDLVREIGISYITLKRIKNEPSTCSLQTLRKLKRFVDEFNAE